ncbi:MAG: 3-hydroxyacyl-CoA dehydrogenase NAD-binding domain-containing protein [Acidobacteriota bacterium]
MTQPIARPIERVAVLGAGTMGAAIAAHVANAGLHALLLDIVPSEPSEAETRRGLTRDDRAVRDRPARDGLDRIAKLKPPSFVSAAARTRVEIGNFDDDLSRLAEVDWVVEAVVERLDIKRDLMARVEAAVRPGTLVTTNTSGLPIHQIVEGRSDDFRRHFFGTHFFNPPRYMKLLELIAGDDTDPAAFDAFAHFAASTLGKGVVRTKDTPNFIGNRILSVHGAEVMAYAIGEGYSFEEVDAVTGPLIGRPKTATFRLQDLVGIDVADGVARNLYDLIPDDDHRDALVDPAVAAIIGGLKARGWLGNKTKQGFYRKTKQRDAKGKPVFEVLQPETFDYAPATTPDLPSVAAVRKTRALGDRLRALFGPDFRDARGARLAWQAVARLLRYSAAVAPEIAHDLPSIDRAIRWGFSYEAGPFELWDALGVRATAERLRASDFAVAPWVEAMLAAGVESFYRRDDDGRVIGVYSWDAAAYVDLPRDPHAIDVASLVRDAHTVEANDSARLIDLGDDVLLLAFESKMNAIDLSISAMMSRAAERLRTEHWRALVIGNDGANFSVGANLNGFVQAFEAGDWSMLEDGCRQLQHALVALRRAPKPVVAAVHGMALGGGCEVALGVDRIVAASESYIGLVEVGVGVVPAGGGLLELVRRLLGASLAAAGAQPGAKGAPQVDPLPALQQILQLVGTAKVSGSAQEAHEMGFLTDEDRIVMNRDHLLHEAKREALHMAETYVADAPATLWAAGASVAAALQLGIWGMQQSGWATEHDAHIGRYLATVLAGGRAARGRWVDEEHFLRLERESLVALAQTAATQDRIRHMLTTGKPLRN